MGFFKSNGRTPEEIVKEHTKKAKDARKSGRENEAVISEQIVNTALEMIRLRKK